MYDTICTLPLPSDLFALATHPTAPLLALGLSSGHVHTHLLPPSSSPSPTKNPTHNLAPTTNDTTNGSPPGTSTITPLWHTHRHKGSTRALAFSPSGDTLFSAGSDGLVKAAVTETGVVKAKIALSGEKGTAEATPSLLHVLTPSTLLLATDASPLRLYDLRAPTYLPSSRPVNTFTPHTDYISALSPFPAHTLNPTINKGNVARTTASTNQILTTGGTTLTLTDLRKGTLSQSLPQTTELLSLAVLNNSKDILVGGGEGKTLHWRAGEWSDWGSRIRVSREGESLDALCAVPGRDGEVAVGVGDGRVVFVRVGAEGGRVVGEVRHDDLEGVVGVGFFEGEGGRMVSGGGGVVKVWGWRGRGEEGEGEVDGSEGSESEDEGVRRKKRKKRRRKEKGGAEHVLGFQGMD
ncbi:WD repeat-containing protein jip5 [Toensbergia leucococca]|nr:WD repeat-containing protein jip5 [Toensbergia leucococca]